MGETEAFINKNGGGSGTSRLFCEMFHLYEEPGLANPVWRENVRWLKFEEKVEDGGGVFSQPHVAALPNGSMKELEELMTESKVILDCEADSFEDLVEIMVENLVSGEDSIAKILNSEKVHQFEAKTKLKALRKGKESAKKEENAFQKRIESGDEAVLIFCESIPSIKTPQLIMARLKNSTHFENCCEVDIDTKFVFVLLGPESHDDIHEMGRCIGTLMSDETFQKSAQKAENKDDFIAGVKDFLQGGTVLPPGQWDPSVRIEPPTKVPKRKRLLSGQNSQDPEKPLVEETSDENEEDEDEDNSLERTGRLFGGMIEDIKRKAPFFASDWTDAVSLQCLSSGIFLFFAVITPVITFGGLWGDATNQEIGAMESIFGAAIAGVAYHLFSGQPLTIIGCTGPILVFDTIVYSLCTNTLMVPFLPFRMWIGIWTGFFCILIVAFDLSFLVKYITRYTEESFSTLISLIFIIDGAKKIWGVNTANEFRINYDKNEIVGESCECLPREWNSAAIDWPENKTRNDLLADLTKKAKGNAAFDEYLYKKNGEFFCMFNKDLAKIAYDPSSVEFGGKNLVECKNFCGELVGDSCNYTGDVFLFSLILAIGTFVLATYLKGFKTKNMFTTKIRALVSDFAVITAIILMVTLDLLVGISTPKLIVPNKFEPTLPDVRGWIIPFFGDEKMGRMDYHYAFVAMIPAALATILVFLDQQITAVIVNRRENKLKKGVGYHLDLFVVSVMIITTSIMGLPWFVAATVLSITHVNSLKQESETAAPGEKASFLGIREQRVTGLAIFILIGLSVLITGALSYIPMPVLYGVFLYMGISSLSGVQLVERLKLFIIPAKHQPDYVYTRHVPQDRVKLFTGIQICGLMLLWVIKKTPPYSIMFPLMVGLIVLIRMMFSSMKIFTERELSWLDDCIPEDEKAEKESKK